MVGRIEDAVSSLITAMNHCSEGRQRTEVPRDSTLAWGSEEGLPYRAALTFLPCFGVRPAKAVGLSDEREGMVSLCWHLLLSSTLLKKSIKHGLPPITQHLVKSSGGGTSERSRLFCLHKGFTAALRDFSFQKKAVFFPCPLLQPKGK